MSGKKGQKKVVLTKGNLTREFNKKDSPALIKDGWKKSDSDSDSDGDGKDETDNLDLITEYIIDAGFKSRAEILVKDAKEALGFAVTSPDLDDAWELVQATED